jgi:hypothetical protein
MAVYFWPISSGGGGGGGGDASAANQTLQITQATLTNTRLNNVTGTDGAAAPANAFVMGGVTSGGTFQTFETNASGHLNVSDGGGSITVDGPLTDTQLRAAAVPVSGTVAVTGVATAARQDTQTTELTAIKTAVELIDDTVGATGAVVPGKAIALGLQDNNGNLVIAPATENGVMAVGNAVKKFRDGFADLAQGAAPDSAIWDVSWTSQGSSSAGRAGDAQGSSYMKVSMCPITPGSEFVMTTKRSFKYPMRFLNLLSISQRIIGQEFEVSIVGVDGAGVITTLTPKTDLSILGTVSITSNVATINFASAHGLKTSDRVILVGNTERRLNVGPVSVTVVTATQITVPCTLANASYTAGGVVRWVDPLAYAKNGAGLLHENATATNATFMTRRNGFNTRLLNSTIVTTANATTVNYADPFNATSMNQVVANQEEFTLIPRAPDSVAAPGAPLKWQQGLPDEEVEYKIRVRAKNLDNFTVPVARITAIAKTGTTTATVTTDVAHGLATTDFVQIYGVRDITNFPNLTALTAVASIISPTQFTIIIGSASTTSSAGGTVFRNQGSVLAPGISAINVQSIARTANVISLVGNTTWTGYLPGEMIHLYGCDATSMGLYDGAYKVLRINTTTLELESVGGDFVAINCGGAVMRRSDFRVHAISEIEHTRLVAELSNGQGSADNTKAIPVNVPGSVTVTASNLSTNIAQANGVAVLMGAGPTGTGSLRTTQANTATATLANVAASATNVTLLALNATRMGASFYNDSTAILYLKLGATASTTSFTVLVPPGGYYELPQPCYSGVIDGIWASATGNCRVSSW